MRPWDMIDGWGRKRGTDEPAEAPPPPPQPGNWSETYSAHEVKLKLDEWIKRQASPNV